jgi:hypothetical protein
MLFRFSFSIPCLQQSRGPLPVEREEAQPFPDHTQPFLLALLAQNRNVTFRFDRRRGSPKKDYAATGRADKPYLRAITRLIGRGRCCPGPIRDRVLSQPNGEDALLRRSDHIDTQVQRLLILRWVGFRRRAGQSPLLIRDANPATPFVLGVDPSWSPLIGI